MRGSHHVLSCRGITLVKLQSNAIAETVNQNKSESVSMYSQLNTSQNIREDGSIAHQFPIVVLVNQKEPNSDSYIQNVFKTIDS